MTRTVVCRCEDVTARDVEAAFQKGHSHVEEVKRYTGFGTGPCGGKECLAVVGKLLSRLANDSSTVRPFSARPPVAPVSLRALAGVGDLDALPPIESLREPPVSNTGQAPPESLPDTADIVIVGAGIMGLAIAYELARRGQRDVVVLEKAYLNYGASGRNGGGIRLQWSTEMTIDLMRESLAICRRFASDMNINVWLRQGGYLFLARTAAESAALEASVAVQTRCGVHTRLLAPRDIHRAVAEIDPAGVIAASYNPDDAVIFPWPFLWGYARQAEHLGVRIHPFTPVCAIDRRASGIARVHTPRGAIETRTVIAATGAWTPEIAQMTSVNVPSWPHRHEICSTESLKPWLGPLVAELGSGLYFSQSMRGEIVGGIALPDDEQIPHETRRVTLAGRLLFLREMARGLMRVVPRLGDVKVLRQWAGPYDMTPDGHPLVGEHPHCPGLWLCSGFVGHGFMMAPAVARHMADALTGRGRHAFFEQWRVDRFREPLPALPQEPLNIG